MRGTIQNRYRFRSFPGLVLLILLFVGCDSDSEETDESTSSSGAIPDTTETVVSTASPETPWLALQFQDAPADNPLKGFTRWHGGRDSQNAFDFPHSMEFAKIRLNQIQTDWNQFDWEELDDTLNEAQERGHQTIFRIVLDEPRSESTSISESDYLPSFLVDSNVDIWLYSGDGRHGYSPDYEDTNLKNALLNLISALGSRYDGDSRIAFIQVALIGHWGEWHTTYNGSLMPPDDYLEDILSAFDTAFNQTKIMARNPTKGSPRNYNIGYHDDTFAYRTITHDNTSTNMMDLLTEGNDLNKWQREPFGGEISNAVYTKIFYDDESLRGESEDFSESVRQTHASWIKSTGLFSASKWSETTLPADFRANAIQGALELGYSLYVESYKMVVATASLDLSVRVSNRGVAPFYYQWPVIVGLLDANGSLVVEATTAWNITEIEAADTGGTTPDAQEFTYSIDTSNLAEGTYRLVIAIPNPMSGGAPLRFANSTQDSHLSGWLSLGQFSK